MGLDDKTFEKSSGISEVQEEYIERRNSSAEEVTQLSGIEATAASKAAWLISITVSLGGFLFGMSFEHSCTGWQLTKSRL